MNCRNRAEPYAVLCAVLCAEFWRKNGTDIDEGAEKRNAESRAVVRADDFAEFYAEEK